MIVKRFLDFELKQRLILDLRWVLNQQIYHLTNFGDGKKCSIKFPGFKRLWIFMKFGLTEAWFGLINQNVFIVWGDKKFLKLMKYLMERNFKSLKFLLDFNCINHLGLFKSFKLSCCSTSHLKNSNNSFDYKNFKIFL